MNAFAQGQALVDEGPFACGDPGAAELDQAATGQLVIHIDIHRRYGRLLCRSIRDRALQGKETIQGGRGHTGGRVGRAIGCQQCRSGRRGCRSVVDLEVVAARNRPQVGAFVGPGVAR